MLPAALERGHRMSEPAAITEDVRRALREKRARYEAELEQAPKRGARAYARVVAALGGRSRRSEASRIGSPEG